MRRLENRQEIAAFVDGLKMAVEVILKSVDSPMSAADFERLQLLYALIEVAQWRQKDLVY